MLAQDESFPGVFREPVHKRMDALLGFLFDLFVQPGSEFVRHCIENDLVREHCFETWRPIEALIARYGLSALQPE